MKLLRIAALQFAAYFIVSLGYLTLSRLLVLQTFILDATYLLLTVYGLGLVLGPDSGWRERLSLALGGASGGAAAILAATAAGVR